MGFNVLLILLMMQIVKLELAVIQKHNTLQLIENVRIILHYVNQMELVVLIFQQLVPL